MLHNPQTNFITPTVDQMQTTNESMLSKHSSKRSHSSQNILNQTLQRKFTKSYQLQKHKSDISHMQQASVPLKEPVVTEADLAYIDEVE